MSVIRFDSKAEVVLLLRCVDSYRDDFYRRFHRLLEPLRLPLPPKVQAYFSELTELHSLLSRHSQQGDEEEWKVGTRFGRHLRDAAIWKRLRVAQEADERRAFTTDPDLHKELDSEVEEYTRLLAGDWFSLTETVPAPQLTEVFPVEYVEADQAKQQGVIPPRIFDEKFHILQAPALFFSDLDAARRAATVRGILTAVAYVDIDEFKTLNSEHGNAHIDRHMLPKFMRKLEAHVFTRGNAYRYGGDEYVILLTNVTEFEAAQSMERLRCGLAELSYEGILRKVTVSIGVAVIRPDSYLTAHEIEHAAERAKDFAKTSGRNRVATYNSPHLKHGDWRIVNDGPGGEIY